MDLLRVYEEAFGATPAAVSLLPIKIGITDLESLIDARARLSGLPTAPVEVHQIWPLVSHHRFNSHTLFGKGGTAVDRRTLTYLLAFDGVVAADPLVQVVDLFEARKLDLAVQALMSVTAQLAEVEPLIEAGRLRFTDARPSFNDTTRKQVLEAFGIGPDFLVFTNFLEAYEMTRGTAYSESWLYISQAHELFELMGVRIPPMTNVDETHKAVQALGQALIHLSWQLAVASGDPQVDIAMSGATDEELFSGLMSATLPVALDHHRSLKKTRNFQLVGNANIPNLDRVNLSIEDALAVRQDDSFEVFRDALQKALDEFTREVGRPRDEGDRLDAFESAMREASLILRERVRTAPFRSRIATAAAQTGVQVAAAYIPSEWIGARLGAELLASPLATLLLDWLAARQGHQPSEIALRYSVKLARVGVPRTP